MNIKAKLILAITSMLIPMTSCNRDVVNACLFTNDEIRFGSNDIKVEAKAFVETVNTTLQENGFVVAAVVDADKSVMFNKAVTYDISSTSYSISGEHYFYPKEGTMSFYGVYPLTEVIDVDGEGVATVAYTHDTEEDLTVAKAVAVSRQPLPVAMDFEHLLSQVTMTAKTDNANLTCRIYGITVTAADGGTYDFNGGGWTLNTTSCDYAFFAAADGKAVTVTADTIGSAMSFMPGAAKLNIKWKCFNKVGGQLLSSNDQTVDVELEKGKHLTLNLTLSSNSSEMTFNTNVGTWVNDSCDIEVKNREFVFTVNNEGKKVKFSPGNLYWNGSEFKFEEHQYDFSPVRDLNHLNYFYWDKSALTSTENYLDYYAAINNLGITPTTSDTFFAADGGAIEGWTVLSSDEWKYIIDNSLHTDICETVKMYNDEDYDRHFYFTGTYEQAKAALAADVESFYGDNFDYLIENEIIKAGETISRNIAGIGCAILKPDGFDGEIKESYTAEEWAEAESAYGLVALPFTGYSNELQMFNIGRDGIYCSGTPSEDDKERTLVCWINYNEGGVWSNNRSAGRPVRLVQVVQ